MPKRKPSIRTIGDVPHSPGIYEIKCHANGKSYVGQAKDLKRRYWGHNSRLRLNKSSQPLLQNAFNKYGVDAFAFRVVICDVEIDELTPLEWWYIRECNGLECLGGLNLSDATKSPWTGRKRPGLWEKCRHIKLENGSLELIEHDGFKLTMADWARKAGISHTGLLDRLNTGMSFAEAVSYPSTRYPTYSAFGITATLKELCKIFDQPVERVSKRINTYGWSLEKALTETNLREKFVLDGVAQSLPDWCKEYRVPYARTVWRISQGWSLEDALTKPNQNEALAA